MTTQRVREKPAGTTWATLSNFMIGFRLAARVLLYIPSHTQDSTYHGLGYTSCGALAGRRNSSMGPPWRIDPTTHCTMSGCSTMKLQPAAVIYKIIICSCLGRSETLVSSLQGLGQLKHTRYTDTDILTTSIRTTRNTRYTDTDILITSIRTTRITRYTDTDILTTSIKTTRNTLDTQTLISSLQAIGQLKHTPHTQTLISSLQALHN